MKEAKRGSGCSHLISSTLAKLSLAAIREPFWSEIAGVDASAIVFRGYLHGSIRYFMLISLNMYAVTIMCM